MSSFQSALMSWRDKGFDLEHLNKSDRRKVFEVVFAKVGLSCQVVADNVINDIQRIEQRMRDKDVIFYSDNPPTMFDRHLDVVDMSEYPERWVRVVGRESLTDLDELLNNFER